MAPAPRGMNRSVPAAWLPNVISRAAMLLGRRLLAPSRSRVYHHNRAECSGPQPVRRPPHGQPVVRPAADDATTHMRAKPSLLATVAVGVLLAFVFASQAGGSSQRSSALEQRRAVEADRQRRRRRRLHRGQGRRSVRGHSLDLPERAAQRERGDHGSPGRHVREPASVSATSDDRHPLAGYLCIYPNQPELINVALTTEGLINAEPHPIYNGRRGFKIVWTAASSRQHSVLRGLGVPCAVITPRARRSRRALVGRRCSR